ncbi:MAG: hypothetical protein CML21_00595 [Rheinheimera sp.]|nr:hypothetical protein [Rheinheimera sp.]|tara:strand:- start:7891 stop:9120 length:1230 start_codon:yes stop_codon:yes gene_type:complete
MLIVTKGNLRVIRSLNDAERRAILAHYGHGNASSSQQTLAQSVASFAKSSESWIKCDCATNNTPAYLFPRQNDTGTITLVRPRPPRQNPHGTSCPFYLADLPQETEAGNAYKSPALIQDFCLLSPDNLSEGPSNEPRVGQQTPSRKQLPRLTRVLLNLLDSAGINHLDESFPFSEHHKAIYKSASMMPMWPGANLMLSDVLSTSTTVSHYYSLVNRLKSEKRFGSKRRKQGYVIALATAFSEYSVTLQSGQEVKLLGKIAAPSRVPNGPYWAIILIAEPRAGSNYFDPIRASLWPAYSERLPFVVDSDPERHTLKELISWRLYWRDRGQDFAITKPLDFSTSVKPDFVIVDNESGNQVVIETMGSKDEKYLLRKVHTHEQMARIGPVIEHRVDDDSLTFKKSVTAAMMG